MYSALSKNMGDKLNKEKGRAEFRESRRRRRGDGSSGTNHASLDALSTHEELDILKVEHSCTFSSQTCALQDLQTQEKDLRSQFEVAVWEKAESDIMLGMSKERMGSLMDEVEEDSA
ncbi:hypothetical protein EV702DRAFT_1202732 [Suillus placidus]|uniref:Uncharacterized protein n=1 Tax=Suillus placidus TaxID=48579 RepID=A0A9P6ZKZ0_9AGAM|nr:hypothetical protein EV702DRAFT_1202732 [Suillus placidus]